LTDPEYTYSVKVVLYHNDVLSWDRICTDAVELFGLPGERYITDLGGNSMDWIFRNPQDALLFKLKFSEVAC